MQVTANDIRDRMASLPTERLEQIAQASPGEYTEQAIDAARNELAARPSQALTEVAKVSDGQPPWSVGESLRSLAALVLTWVGWVGVIGCVRFVLNPTAILYSLFFAFVAFVAFWLAFRISTASRRLIVVVPLLFGVLFLIRAAFSSQPGEHAFSGVLLLIGGTLAAAIRYLSRRHRS